MFNYENHLKHVAIEALGNARMNLWHISELKDVEINPDDLKELIDRLYLAEFKIKKSFEEE